MASITWKSGATAIAQVVTLTLGGTWEADDVLNVTLFDEAGSSKLIATVSGSTVIATIATTLAAALNASTDARFAAVTWAAGATTVTGTADTAGAPIYCSVTTTETGGGAADAQTFVASITTASSGPYDWNIAANWSTGTVPVDADNVFIDGTVTTGILYGLYQTTALVTLDTIELGTLKIEQGAPQIGTLDAPLCVQYATLDVGAVPGDGLQRSSSSIWNLKPGDYAVAGTIRSTANQGSGGRAPLQISANVNTSTFIVMGQSIVGFSTGVNAETGSIATITVRDTAQVTCGAGLTLVTLNPEGGKTTLNAGLTTVAYGLGEVTVYGGNITTVNAGGKFNWDSSGTITTYSGQGKSAGRFWRGVVTNANINGGVATIDASLGGIPATVIAMFPNGIDYNDGSTSQQTNLGDGITMTPSAI